MSDGRKQSDLTVPIDRARLPPISMRSIAQMGLDPDHPETLELMRDAQSDSKDRITLVPCPRCEACTTCKGSHMVTPTQAAEYEPDGEPPEAA